MQWLPVGGLSPNEAEAVRASATGLSMAPRWRTGLRIGDSLEHQLEAWGLIVRIKGLHRSGVRAIEHGLRTGDKIE